MWKAIYFYLHSVQQQEAFLREASYLLEHYNNKWFFIKYWYGGPHLRFRFLNPSDEFLNSFDKLVADFSHQSVAPIISPTVYYSNINFSNEGIVPNNLPWHKHGTWFYTEYQPEFERYGTGTALELSENSFFVSSKLALKIIKLSDNFSLSKRIAIASIVMKELLKITDCWKESFLKQYSDYWKSYDNLNELSKKNVYLITKKSIGIPNILEIKDFTDEISIIWSELLKVLSFSEAQYVLSSQIHMNNNRISVTPEFEYIIAKSLSKLIMRKTYE